MRASYRPSLILVHGAWQTAHVMSPLAKRLADGGHDVKVPALPSPGTAPAVPDFSIDVSAVRTVIMAEVTKGKDVVVIMHSYGAVVGCEALKGIKPKRPSRYNHFGISAGGVARLIFIAGMVLPVGVSCWSAMGKGWKLLEGVLENDLIKIPDGHHRFYNDLPEPEAAELAKALLPHSLFALSSPLTHPAYNQIPSSYLLCTLDNALPLKVQERMVANAGIKDVGRIETGHVPFANPEKAG